PQPALLLSWLGQWKTYHAVPVHPHGPGQQLSVCPSPAAEAPTVGPRPTLQIPAHGEWHASGVRATALTDHIHLRAWAATWPGDWQVSPGFCSGQFQHRSESRPTAVPGHE